MGTRVCACVYESGRGETSRNRFEIISSTVLVNHELYLLITFLRTIKAADEKSVERNLVGLMRVEKSIRNFIETYFSVNYDSSSQKDHQDITN